MRTGSWNFKSSENRLLKCDQILFRPKNVTSTNLDTERPITFYVRNKVFVGLSTERFFYKDFDSKWRLDEYFKENFMSIAACLYINTLNILEIRKW